MSIFEIRTYTSTRRFYDIKIFMHHSQLIWVFAERFSALAHQYSVDETSRHTRLVPSALYHSAQCVHATYMAHSMAVGNWRAMYTPPKCVCFHTWILTIYCEMWMFNECRLNDDWKTKAEISFLFLSACLCECVFRWCTLCVLTSIIVFILPGYKTMLGVYLYAA